ncbi:TPA: hypothetical protein ACH3X1_010337 [Trebouxia sp. C0004]
MGPAKPALVRRPQVPMGIHDLLEQSINRSRHYSGSNHASTASPSQVSKISRQGQPNKAEHAPQGKDSRGATLQATLPEAVFPKVSMSALKGDGGLGDAERTAVPERRRLDYSNDGKADKSTGGQSQSCAPAKGMTTKKVMRSPRVPSPLNRLHSTPVAALLLGSDRNNQVRSETAYKRPASRAQEVPKEQPAPSRPVTSPSRPLTHSGDGVRFRSEAVGMEVALRERLSQLDLELPPSAAKHRQHGRLQLAQHTLATLCTGPMLATDGLLQFVQTEYNQALSGSMHEAQQASTMSASLIKTNWINSGLRSQVKQLQSRLSDSNSLTARLQREMLLVKAKAEALEFSVSEKDAEIELLRQKQERQDTQVVQLMEDKEALLRQQAAEPAGMDKSQQKVLQMKGNVMNRLLKYANEAILSVEDIKGMDEATFIASLHSSDDANQ